MLWFLLILLSSQILTSSCKDVNRQSITSLHLAARIGDYEHVKQLLEEGAEADARMDDVGLTPLYRAAQGGHRDIMELLLNNTADLEAKVLLQPGNPGISLLMFAIRSNESTATESLLSMGANSSMFAKIPIENVTNPFVTGILEYGANINDCLEGRKLYWHNVHKILPDMIELLIEYNKTEGMDTNKYDLIKALVLEKEEDAIEIISEGVSTNATYSHVHYTPIHISSMLGLTKVLKELVKNGSVDVNEIDVRNATALHYARNKEIADILINNKAAVNHTTTLGETPLHYAIRFGRLQVVKALVDAKAAINIRSTELEDMKDDLQEHELNKRWMKNLMQQKKKNININYHSKYNESNYPKGNLGFSPLSYAVWKKKYDIVKYLVNEHRKMINNTNFEWPPLHIAAYLGDLKMTDILIKSRANIDLTDSFGWTPLHKAIMTGSKEAVKMLLEKNANVNVRDSYNWTAIHIATKYQHLEIAKLLLSHSADVGSYDSGGFTTLMWAEAGGHPVFLDLMVDKTLDLNSTNRYGYFQSITANEVNKITDWLRSKIGNFNNSEVRQFLIKKLKDINYNIKETIKKPTCSWMESHNFKKIPFDEFKNILEARIEKEKREHLDLFKLILKQTSMEDIKKQDDIMGWTALHWAAGCGDLDVVRELTKRLNHISPKSKLSQTPMFLARYWGHKSVYDFFKRRGGVW